MFDEKKITIDETVEARKQKIADEDAWDLLSGAEKIIVGKGKKVVTFDPKTDPKEDILKSCLGRTGNLRAPTLKIGSMLVVGFNEDMYSEYVG
ncbi:MAG TPA: hypothetical protein ENK89_06790 [Desulfobulbaceae bacterium]|nr:hypothetical protein [Desulfobulbaceae bacterium]